MQTDTFLFWTPYIIMQKDTQYEQSNKLDYLQNHETILLLKSYVCIDFGENVLYIMLFIFYNVDTKQRTTLNSWEISCINITTCSPSKQNSTVLTIYCYTKESCRCVAEYEHVTRTPKANTIGIVLPS